ncbi:GTPase HflX [bacterium]|nr:GTPase HflX [bacterium]MBU1600105.1 GTPase HflX [bacterium]MBU2461492.1 GTPase HflX [bacterium]
METAGGKVLTELIQKGKRDAACVLRKGKFAELKELVEKFKVRLVVFNQELSGTQGRNLEEELETKVLDRTGLILDIFAQRAKTAEAKLQVELAQAQYILPKLAGSSFHLSRLGGGIGTRGPGETKLESDRRRIRERISALKKAISSVRKERIEQRKKRKKAFLSAAIVGYTNAGKSTLFTRLTKKQVFADNLLFATLDPTTSKIRVEGRDITLTDTVGFIQNLPTSLILAFSATLLEVSEADIILHIVDLSNPMFREQMKSVEEVLEGLGASLYPRITVFNKIDLVDRQLSQQVRQGFSNSVAVSALSGEGIEELLAQFQNLSCFAKKL